MAPPRPVPRDGLVSVIVILTVTFVWAISILVGFLEHEWQAALYTTPLMGAIVGYITGIRIWRNGKE
jgi:ribose/xylose/arabinose/galactoside ABC-type transport system permease subunit